MSPDRNSRLSVPSTVDDALTATAAGFGIGGAALAIVAPPAAVVLGVGAGATQLLQLVQRRWGKRMSQVAYGARERLGPEESEAARRITENEDLAALAYQAVDASILSHHEEQARVLGRVLGEALKAEPAITVDKAAMVIEALRSLDQPHFEALIELNRSPSNEPWRQPVSHALDTQDEAALSGVALALQRAGAVVIRQFGSRPGPSRASDGQVRDEHLTYSVTSFGKLLLSYMDD